VKTVGVPCTLLVDDSTAERLRTTVVAPRWRARRRRGV
jgi:hypothetical protein